MEILKEVSTSTPSTLERLGQLSDENLYKLCRTYGHRSLKWRYKFIGLLPEVYRRNLFEKKGFSSIFVFAFQLAGLSEVQVRRTLNLEKRFEEKGLFQMKVLLVEGMVSMNKLERVVSIANKDNESELVEKVRLLPKSTLETMVKDFKHQNGLFEPKFRSKSVPGHTNSAEFLGESNGGVATGGGGARDLHLSPDILQKLLELQRKGIDLNRLLGEFLEERHEKIEIEKQKIVEDANGGKTEKEWSEIDQAMGVMEVCVRPVRYVPAKTRQILKKEFGEKCAIPHCALRAAQIHHTDRFALSGRHNPYYLAPLCKAHHQLAHAVDERVREKRMERGVADHRGGWRD